MFAARWSCRPISGSTSTNTGQFERTLIIAEKGSYVSAIWKVARRRMRDENQLHAAVVELVALDDAEIKYSTVQNWFPGDKPKARAASTTSSPSVVTAVRQELQDFLDPGRDRFGNHLEVPVLHPARRRTRAANSIRSRSPTAYQQVDSGTKMIHLGKNSSRAASSRKAFRRAKSQNTYRGLVSAHRKASNARNFTQL